MKKISISFATILMIISLSSCSQQPTVTANRIDQLNVIYSADQSMKVYLEKEYDSQVQRFIRQSVVLENTKLGNKLILNEIKVSPEEALTLYTEDGCNADKNVCCNSIIGFNKFEPIKWIDDSSIEVNEYFDNYECAGAVPVTSVYNTEGKEIERWIYNAAGERETNLLK